MEQNVKVFDQAPLCSVIIVVIAMAKPRKAGSTVDDKTFEEQILALEPKLYRTLRANAHRGTA